MAKTDFVLMPINDIILGLKMISLEFRVKSERKRKIRGGVSERNFSSWVSYVKG
jgi:hypothetical protein